MLVMAIEAVKQMADRNRPTVGYRLKDISFHTALAIPTNARGIEVQFYLRQVRDAGDKDSPWSDFRLCAFEGEQWQEICRGTVRVEYEISSNDVEGANNQGKQFRRDRDRHSEARLKCIKHVDTLELYKFLGNCGIDFGSAFQSITNARHQEKSRVTADISIFEWSSALETNQRQPHVVHPCTLDGLFQLPVVAYTNGGTETTLTAVPSLVRSMWVAASGLSWPDGTHLKANANILTKDNRGVEACMSALNHSGEQLGIDIDGARFTFVSSSTLIAQDQPLEKHVLWNLDWKPDLNLLNKQRLLALCKTRQTLVEEPILFYKNISFLVYAFISKTLTVIDEERPEHLQAHIYKYIQWARWQMQRFNDGQMPSQNSEWEALAANNAYVESLCTSIEQANAQGKVYATVGKNLLGILYGRVNVLDLLFRSTLLEDLYQELSDGNNSFRTLVPYLDCLAHNNPRMRFLEIGAGTGGSTTQVLGTLFNHKDQNAAVPRYSEYTFTDISQAFFEKAQDKFRTFPNMSYK